ncbi:MULTISPECIES: fimbrial protein [Enterobacteriaceae]|uniref:Fimbrial protein n=1 Tax=Raoultella lignicola TaxID=3040939 RepID=A0ABU9FEQ1_9ENTR|nr:MULTISPECIES: fimbrial protein [Enterobacteriaceae]MRT47428.1 fimbrial protein [Raoultella sp. RIT712]QNK09810.1 type 1 fimbrial protein [Enterobacter sp. JUb54]ROS14012.1 type 1 fimbria pilin [Raoultella sp. BIGb0399]
MNRRMDVLTAFAIMIAGLAGRNALASCQIGEPAEGKPSLTAPAISVVPLAASISAPADLPVGTVLYRGAFQAIWRVSIICTQSGAFYRQLKVIDSGADIGSVDDFNVPATLIPSGSRVYTTSLPGVGVAFNTGAQGNDLVSAASCSDSINCSFVGAVSTGEVIGAEYTLSVLLIKTASGPVTPGMINGESLPSFERLYGQADSMVVVQKSSLKGSVTVTAPTCTTPDVKVMMGTWDASQFAGKGSGTEWQDASIRMTGCGQFHGYYAGHTQVNGGAVSSNGPATQNQYTFKLTPLTTIIDNTSGIMAVDAGESSAGGVGIQIGIGSLTSAASNFIRFNRGYSANLPVNGFTSMSIPLAARYVQTGERITGGTANGKVTFTVQYK